MTTTTMTVAEFRHEFTDMQIRRASASAKLEAFQQAARITLGDAYPDWPELDGYPKNPFSALLIQSADEVISLTQKQDALEKIGRALGQLDWMDWRYNDPISHDQSRRDWIRRHPDQYAAAMS